MVAIQTGQVVVLTDALIEKLSKELQHAKDLADPRKRFKHKLTHRQQEIVRAMRASGMGVWVISQRVGITTDYVHSICGSKGEKTRKQYDTPRTGYKQPEVPTDAVPGTPEKIAVLQARVEAGEYLFHPDDRRW